MTEYGRGPGSQPWHPEDPLYGDQEWNGGLQGGWDPLTGPYADPNADPHGAGRYAQAPASYQHDPYQTGQFPAGQYDHGQYDHGQYDTGQYATGQYDTGWFHPGQYDTGQFDTGQYDAGQYGTGQYGPDGYPYGHEQHGHGYQQHPGHQGGGQGGEPFPQGGEPFPHGGRPYSAQPHDAGSTDPYGMPPVAAPGTRDEQGADDRPAGPGSGLPRSGPDPDTGWDPGPDQGESSFFTDPDEEEGRAADDAAGRRGDRKRGGGKRRSGGACLVVVLLLGGVLGVAGWFGYQFYESHFAAAPDFDGEGHGEVQVEIPDGSSVADMAAALEDAGVVRTSKAFVEASAADGNVAQSIQPGIYTLRKEMSAEAAIELMLDPASQSSLIIPEGYRASEVYALIDDRTGSKKGTTAKVAESAELGLPDWADGRVEGFLYPSRYSVTKDSEPAEVLRKMVERATVKYKKADLAGQAERLKLDSPLEVLTVASLVQAEGKYKRDFVKVARVVYNRLQPGNTETNGYLQFDSTYNYAKNQSTLHVPSPAAMAKFEHPYNTYAKKGLPPGPINSPGAEALNAALHPAEGDWYYFVSITEDNTVFSETYEEHKKNVARYEEAQEAQQ